MTDLITSPFGNTPQGTATQALATTLASITGTPPAGTADSMQAAQMQDNYPKFQADTRAQLYAGSGAPQLNQQGQDLSKAFELYLHDSNLASQYAKPTGGDISAYAMTPENNKAPFTGFTSPTAVTNAMGVPANADYHVLDLINQAITGQIKQVDTGTDLASKNYTDKINQLLTMAGLYNQAQDRMTANAQNAVNVPGTTQQAGAAFNDIINQVQATKGGQATENDIWNYINEHDSALRAQGVNVDELWKLHSDLAKKVGTGGVITGGKTGTSFQSKKIGTGENAIVVNFNPKTGKYYDPNTGKPFQISDPTMKSAENVISNIDQIYNSWNSLSDFEKHIPDSLITAVPALSPARAALNTQFYYGLEGDLRKLIVGGRITQQEIQWIKNAIIPTYTDSDASAKAKIDAVKQSIANKLQNPSLDLTKTKLPGASGASGGKNQKDPLGIL